MGCSYILIFYYYYFHISVSQRCQKQPGVITMVFWYILPYDRFQFFPSFPHPWYNDISRLRPIRNREKFSFFSPYGQKYFETYGKDSYFYSTRVTLVQMI